MTESEMKEALGGLGNGPGWKALEQLLDEAVAAETQGAAMLVSADERAWQCGRLAQAMAFREAVRELKGDL